MLIVRSKQIQPQNITKKVLNIHYKFTNEHKEKKPQIKNKNCIVEFMYYKNKQKMHD